DPWQGPPAWRRRLGALLVLLGGLALAAALLRLARAPALLPILVLVTRGAAPPLPGGPLRPSPAGAPGTPGAAPPPARAGPTVVRNLSPAGPEMRFDVLVAPGGEER